MKKERRIKALEGELLYCVGTQHKEIQKLNSEIEGLTPLSDSQTFDTAHSHAELFRRMYNLANSISAYQAEIEELETQLSVYKKES